MSLMKYAPWRSAVATMASLLLAQVTPPTTTAAVAATETNQRNDQTVGRSPDGLFYLPAKLGGLESQLLVDTGANMTILSAEDARAAGIEPADLSYDRQLVTAGGTVRAASTQLDGIEINGRRFDRVGVIITEAEGGISLIGQNLLSRLGTVIMQEDRLIVRALI
jgi:aspartyl protease family protein